MGLKFRQRSGLGDLSRRDHSFIQRLIIEHTPCASHCAGCWATRSLPHGTPGDFIKAAANAMAPDETDEIAHGVCARACARPEMATRLPVLGEARGEDPGERA